jgi:hypothetical protein
MSNYNKFNKKNKKLDFVNFKKIPYYITTIITGEFHEIEYYIYLINNKKSDIIDSFGYFSRDHSRTLFLIFGSYSINNCSDLKSLPTKGLLNLRFNMEFHFIDSLFLSKCYKLKSLTLCHVDKKGLNHLSNNNKNSMRYLSIIIKCIDNEVLDSLNKLNNLEVLQIFAKNKKIQNKTDLKLDKLETLFTTLPNNITFKYITNVKKLILRNPTGQINNSVDISLALSNLKNLQVLHFDNFFLSTYELEKIFTSKSLKILGFRKCVLNYIINEEIVNQNIVLIFIDKSKGNLLKELIYKLDYFKKLEELNMIDCNINKKSLERIKKNLNYKCIDLQQNYIYILKHK